MNKKEEQLTARPHNTKTLLVQAFEKGLPGVYKLLEDPDFKPAADNYAAFLLLFNLFSDKHEQLLILHLMFAPPSVNTEIFIKKELSTEPGIRIQSILFEKYKLLTFFREIL